MIQPNMATTLGYIFTDADISNNILKKLLKKIYPQLLMQLAAMVILAQTIW